MSNKAPEFGLVDENAPIKKLCVTYSGLSKTLCVFPRMETMKVLQKENKKTKHSRVYVLSILLSLSLWNFEPDCLGF